MNINSKKKLRRLRSVYSEIQVAWWVAFVLKIYDNHVPLLIVNVKPIFNKKLII